MKLTAHFNKNGIKENRVEMILDVVTKYESGIIPKVIYQHYIDKHPGCKPSLMTSLCKRLILDYSYHNTTEKEMVLPSRTVRIQHWSKNSLYEYIDNLRKRLSVELDTDIEKHLAVRFTEHSHDTEDLWFKYYNRANRASYFAVKHRAKQRDIAWEFNSFEEWLLWWVQTGKLDQRGALDDDYQMCRKGDTGPYSWDNVYCATGKENRAHYSNDPEKMKIHSDLIKAGLRAKRKTESEK